VHASITEAFKQLGQMLLIAGVAGAGGVPEVHHTDRCVVFQGVGQRQAIARKQLRAFAIEGAQIPGLEPAESGQHGASPEQGDQRCDQIFVAY